MKNDTITLTRVHGEQFEPKMSNKYRVLRVMELINRDDLHYIRLEYDDDISDPSADHMIMGAKTDCLQRVLWDDLLWCSLDDSAASILECCQGVSKERMEAFSDKLAQGSQ